MKRILLSMLFLTLSLLGWAQVKESGDLQIGGFGGASFPLGTYKSIGEPKTGRGGGLFGDQCCHANGFGLGWAPRLRTRSILQEESVFFGSGVIATIYVNAPKFKRWAFTLGPSYNIRSGDFHVEAHLRGGILVQ